MRRAGLVGALMVSAVLWAAYRGNFTALGGIPEDSSAHAAAPPVQVRDQDHDGLDDALEDALAERFAPIILHGEGETSLPVSIEWWLARTELWFVDTSVSEARRVSSGPLTQETLTGALQGSDVRFSSSATRSRAKQRTFFLQDVAPVHRPGPTDPSQWVTYVHSYPNGQGGISLQFWRAYTWNDARILGIDVGHGGDWEAITVHLDASHRPVTLAFLQHTGIVYAGEEVEWEGTHPVVYSEEGGHTSSQSHGVLRSDRTIRQETWTGGSTTWPGAGKRGASGGLINVGEKSAPRNEQVFVRYSGLWGSVGRMFTTSGYWGPAYNETGARCSDGRTAYAFGIAVPASHRSCGSLFFNAWCDGMANGSLEPSKECQAPHETR